MKIALIAPPVPAVPLSTLQREYYFYLFASRALSVFGHLGEEDFSRFWMLEPVNLGLLQLIAFLEENGSECSFFAPIAFIIPISFSRSTTLVAIVFTIPILPTTIEMQAIKTIKI